MHKNLQHFKENLDWGHPVCSTKLGVYSENCGLDKVHMSWGHDEYMYMVSKFVKVQNNQQEFKLKRII